MDQNFQQFVDEIRTENRSFREQFLAQYKADRDADKADRDADKAERDADRDADRKWFHDRNEVVWAQIRALEKSIQATDKSLESSTKALGERITSFMTVIRLLMTLNAGLFVTVITLLIVRAAQ